VHPASDAAMTLACHSCRPALEAWAQASATCVTMTDRQAGHCPFRMAPRWPAPRLGRRSLSAASGGRAAQVVGC
jgi:hypothetical protein